MEAGSAWVHITDMAKQQAQQATPKPNGKQAGADQQQHYSQAAQAALRFIQRVQLSGEEVDVFSAVRGMLAAIAQGQLVVSTPKDDKP